MFSGQFQVAEPAVLAGWAEPAKRAELAEPAKPAELAKLAEPSKLPQPLLLSEPAEPAWLFDRGWVLLPGIVSEPRVMVVYRPL